MKNNILFALLLGLGSFVSAESNLPAVHTLDLSIPDDLKAQ